MKSLTFKLNDKCWIHTGSSKLTKGKVVHMFELYDRPHYVVEVQTHIEPVHYVHDGLTMSDTKKGPIGCYRKGGDNACL